jgi:hypothetical protein
MLLLLIWGYSFTKFNMDSVKKNCRLKFKIFSKRMQRIKNKKINEV